MSEMGFDYGGVEAIKGFSYQNAVIAFIALSNYDNESFSVVPEGAEDADVTLNDETYYLQIKSHPLSASQMITPQKKEKLSMLEKLYNKKKNNKHTCKFVCTECSCRDDYNAEKSPLFISLDESIPILRYRIDTTKAHGLKFYKSHDTQMRAKIIEKLDNTFVLVTPFSKEVSSYQTFLLGVLVKKAIATDNKKSKNLLSIISDMITIKSTYKATNNELYSTKSITGKDISPLIFTNKAEERFEQCLDDAGYETLQKHDIRCAKAAVAIPLITDRNYSLIKCILEDSPQLSQFKYFIKQYIEEAIQLVNNSTESIIGLTENDLISRVLLYFIEKEFQDDYK